MPWRQGFLAETSNPVYLKSSTIQPLLLYDTEERSVGACSAAQEYLCCLLEFVWDNPLSWWNIFLSTGERKLHRQSWALFVADTIVWTSFLILKNTTIVLSLWEDFRCLTLGFFTQFLILNSETLALSKKVAIRWRQLTKQWETWHLALPLDELVWGVEGGRVVWLDGSVVWMCFPNNSLPCVKVFHVLSSH